MKKALSLLLALAMIFCLAVPALAYDLKVDDNTYVFSNAPIGTTTTIQEEYDWDTDETTLKEYTVYIVPVGTVVTHSAGLYLSADCEIDMAGETMMAPVDPALSYTLEEGDLLEIGVCANQEDAAFGSFAPDYDTVFWITTRTDNMKPIDTTAPAETVGAFTDVKADAYYASAVKWGVDNGIVYGTSTTEFSPEVTCTNAQILSYMWRAAGSPEPTVSNPFSDVQGDEYYAKAAVWAYEKGMVSGTQFGAQTDCTRAMTMEYFWKQAGCPATDKTEQFTDVPADASYAEAVAWANANGITFGTSDTTFSPNNTCTRAQIVSYLFRAVGE